MQYTFLIPQANLQLLIWPLKISCLGYDNTEGKNILIFRFHERGFEFFLHIIQNNSC